MNEEREKSEWVEERRRKKTNEEQRKKRSLCYGMEGIIIKTINIVLQQRHTLPTKATHIHVDGICPIVCPIVPGNPKKGIGWAYRRRTM